jgi:hypothetical protein
MNILANQMFDSFVLPLLLIRGAVTLRAVTFLELPLLPTPSLVHMGQQSLHGAGDAHVSRQSVTAPRGGEE